MTLGRAVFAYPAVSDDRVSQQGVEADWANGVQIGDEACRTVCHVADDNKRVVAAVPDIGRRRTPGRPSRYPSAPW